MKQYNIFGTLDHIEDGKIKRCCICFKSIDKGEVCFDKCGEIWVNKFIVNGIIKK